MFNWFKKSDIDFKFADILEGTVYPHYPPVLAKDLKPLKDYQEKKYGEYKFPNCPGMHDYSRLGYIIPAWTNFYIKANKAGTVGFVGSQGKSEAEKRGSVAKQPLPMSKDIADGAHEINGIVHEILNFPGAWKIHSSKNVSLLILPAFYHSTFLDDLFVYPGVVDFKGFTTINFLCAPKRPCEVEIKAGDPVIHVIPFITNKDIVASYGPATTEENDYSKMIRWIHEKNFYRKYYMIKKRFKLVKDV